MKSIKFVIGIGILLTGCSKSDFEWKENCNCGIVTDVDKSIDFNFVEVENNCTGNLETFMIDADRLNQPVIGRGECFRTSW